MSNRTKPTILDIAHQAQVSTATVSHVLNNTRFVSAQVRERVMQASQELGYSPNSLASSLRSGRSKMIGLVIPDSGNPFFAEIARYLEQDAYSKGYSVIICNTEGDPQRELFYIHTLKQKKVDGIIFVSTGGNPESFCLLRNLDIPVVIADRDIDDIDGFGNLTVVLTDNQCGGMIAVQHALDLGHRRIACVSGPSNLSPSATRETGYRMAMENARLPIDEHWIVRGDFTCESGYQAARQILLSPQPPTAIFCCNDMMAFGAIRAAAELNIAIPAELSIIGFDDIPLASYVYPPLTTIRQPLRLICDTITQYFFGAFHPESNQSYQKILFQPTLVVRQSSGPVQPG